MREACSQDKSEGQARTPVEDSADAGLIMQSQKANSLPRIELNGRQAPCNSISILKNRKIMQLIYETEAKYLNLLR